MLLQIIVENRNDDDEIKPTKKLPPAHMKSYLVTSSPDQKQLFWSLELNGKTISLRFDTKDGQVKTEEKSFVSEVIARYEAYQLILNQRDKGYHLADRITMETLLKYKSAPLSKLKGYYTGEGDSPNYILIEGDLVIDELDIDALHGKKDGLIVTGNLYVDGGIYNLEGDYGPRLTVIGDVQADYLFAGGSEIDLDGKTYIHNLVLGHYNHGSLDASGIAMVSINSDHSLRFSGQIDYEYDTYGGFDEEREEGFPSLRQAMGNDFNDLIYKYGLDENKLMALFINDKKRALKFLKNILDANKAGQLDLLKVMKNGEAIKDIKEPTEEIQLAAVKQDGMAIEYIASPSEAVKIAAVSSNCHALELIENPSEEVQLAAVKSLGYGPVALQYIKNPSKNVIIQAVETDSNAIEYIKNPSEALQLLAVSKGSYNTSIQYIKDPSEKVQLAAVKVHGGAIRYIKNPSERVQLEAVKESGFHIENIRNPSEVVKLAAVKSYGPAIEKIKKPSDEMKLAAVMQKGSSIKFIDNPSEEVKLAAVRQDGSAIALIKNPSEKIQMAAMQANLYSFDDIKNPTEKVKETYQRWEICEKHISDATYTSKDKSEEKQLLLRKAIEQCPDYHDGYLQYAKYLTYTRKEYDEAEKYFKKGIEICPTCGQLYFEYGKFLYNVRNQIDTAENNYIKAVEMYDGHDELLFQYALFLVNARKDYEKAKIYTQKALEEIRGLRNNPNYSINHAQVVLITGHRSDADYHIDIAIDSDEPAAQLEGWFYRLAHYPQYFEEAQKELDRLLADGHRSIGWNLDGNIERAKKDGFKDIQLLKDYAKKITSE